MVSDADNRSRPALLSLIMLAVLMLSIGAAWLVAFPRQTAYRHGIDVLHSFDARTLNDYWSRNAESLFIAHDVAGRPIGWKGTLRNHTGNFFLGRAMTRLSALSADESWAISDDLKTADYAASSPHYSVHWQDEIISVKAAMVLPNGIRKVVALPPERLENYLPPCLLELAVARVAKTQQVATFAIVDSSLFAHNQPVIRTLNLTIKPTGPHIVQTTIQSDAAITAIYILGDDGTVSEIQEDRITYKRATREDVEKYFPDVSFPARSTPAAPEEETMAEEPPVDGD